MKPEHGAHDEAEMLLGGPAVLSLRDYARQASELLVSSFVLNLIGLGLPVFSMVVYNKVIGNHVPETLWALAAGAVLFAFLEAVLRSVRAFYVEHVGTRWDALFDARLMAAIVRAPIERLPDMGTVVHRYREAASTRDFLSSSYLVAIADLPFLPVYLVAIILVGGWIVMVPMVLGALLFALLTLTHNISQAYHRASIPVTAAKVSGLSESVMAGEVLRHMPVAARLLERMQVHAEQSAQLLARSRYWNALGMNGANFLSTLATVVTVLVGVYLVEAQELSMGGLIACSSLVSRVLGGVHSIVSARTRYHDFREALAKLAEDVPGATEPLPQTPDEASAQFEGLGDGAPRLVLDRVNYRYSDTGRLVLQDFSLTIEPGERIALLGRAGSGKSTALRLLAGLVTPTEGHYMADHLLVNAQSCATLRARVAIKTQDPQLIQGTLADNVLGGDVNAEVQTLVDLLREVGLAPALTQGELALNTELGPFGQRLSGGQRQMVALARALYAKRAVVILDEPTLGLDQLSQAAVLKAIENLPRSTTVIVATHSAELMSRVDRIVVVEGGRKVADGPRDKILVAAPARPAGGA